MELDRVRKQLPRQWRRIDLKKQLGADKSQADELIRAWQAAGYVEIVPGTSGVYQFIAALSGQSGEVAGRHSSLQRSRPLHRQLPGTRRPALVAAHLVRRVGIGLGGCALLMLGYLGILSLFPPPAAPASSQPALPGLPQAVVAWYAPDGEVFGAINAETAYEPVARYGDAWVQVAFQPGGLFWVRSHELATVDVAALPDLQPPVVGYGIHVVAPGDDLRSIAARSGSHSTLISAYNRVRSVLHAGRPLIVPLLAEHSITLPPQPVLIKHGNTAQPRVALTVDLETGDEPVRQMLAVLRERGVRLTFFVLGAWVEQHPELARQLAADGHELANHSLTHPDFRTIPDAQIAHELAETERLVQAATGSTTRPFFRPPYGGYDDRVLLKVIEQGYLPIHWSVDSRDAVGGEKTPAMLVQQITTVPAPEHLHGGIILTHCCIRTTTADALPALLDHLAALGLSVVTVSEVLDA